MGSLCLSSASILRCEHFSALQSQLLIIPTALELIFSTTLILTNWGTGRRHLLLTAEGWSYFALALLELLSHNLPAVRDSVTVFRTVDIVLGATSFLPIFFYTLFVYLFTRGELIDTLPQRFQRIANVLLLFFIPAIIALNELSSFVGIHYGLTNVDGVVSVAIGFLSFNDQQLWTFLTSLTLALLTAFEAINFCFAFYRLIRAFVDQRRIETTSSDTTHLIRGIGWIAGGFKLGAIETVVGFAQGGFGGALTRRILRFLARAFLIIGIVKGVDLVDDFAEVEKEMRQNSEKNGFRRSRLAMMISNPRFSTFRQLSPTAKDFYDAPRAVPADAPVAGPSTLLAPPQMQQMSNSMPASPLYTLSGPQLPAPAPVATRPPLKRSITTHTTDSAATARSRVTVHFPDPNTAPMLEMRFSGLDIPSPAMIADSVNARPVSPTWMTMARTSRYAPSVAPSFAFDPVPPMTAVPPLPTASTQPYPSIIYDRPADSTARDADSTYTYSFHAPAPPALPAPSASRITPAQAYKSRQQQQQQRHTRGSSAYSGRSSYSLSAVHDLATQFPVPGIPPTMAPSPIREWDEPRAVGGRTKAKEWDAERGDDAPYTYNYNASSRDSAYGASMRGEHEEDEEPVYHYAYDGPVSPVRSTAARIPHPYADPGAYAYSPPRMNDEYSPLPNAVYSPPRMNAAYSPPSDDNAYRPPVSDVYSPPATRGNQAESRHRNMVSDTTLGTTPRTFASSSREGGTSTPNTEIDPFQFDADPLKARYAAQMQDADEGYDYEQAVPEEVRVADGPHAHEGHSSVSSMALLQMTQRGQVDWAPAGVEFTPSVFTASTSTPASSTHRKTLKKKRRPDAAPTDDVTVSSSANTLASSWLHGDVPEDAYADADDEGAVAPSAAPARVKSVGRVRAPRKATPAPVLAKHGLTRGSVYIQPITVPPAVYSHEVQIVQGGSSADSYNSEFAV
ncbi:hypothetical protein R3P38DRAFT_2888873 [Favolaschia claudopus]|uniref:Uncharacterized protein n=1 Tax=Favolaschia claudopus TaxID=2862362 RepID=A0AAW0CUR2_9AGAR